MPSRVHSTVRSAQVGQILGVLGFDALLIWVDENSLRVPPVLRNFQAVP